jgi:hypothetical protein
MKSIAVVLAAALAIVAVLALKVAINAGIVAVICYWLMPLVGAFPEPDVTECFVYGASLLLIGIALDTGSKKG